MLAAYLLVMLRLGSAPNQVMDAIAAFSREFLHGHAPAHPVDYFSSVNLRGAAISLVIGAFVYLLIVRLLLVRRRRYIDPIPVWLNLEDRVYRPAVRFFARSAVVLATLLDLILARGLFQELPCRCAQVGQGVRQWWNDLAVRLTGGHYTPQPSVEQAADDYHFARYDDAPRYRGGFVHSLAFGLILTGFGLAFGLLFVLLYGMQT